MSDLDSALFALVVQVLNNDLLFPVEPLHGLQILPELAVHPVDLLQLIVGQGQLLPRLRNLNIQKNTT